jgi:hypothetical protein
VECDEPGCFATFSDSSTLTRHRQSIHGALTRAEVRARRQADVEENTAVGKVGQPCRMRVAAVESEMAQRALPPAMESSSESFSHAIDVPTDCMSPDINQSKLEHQLVAVAHSVAGNRSGL